MPFRIWLGIAALCAMLCYSHPSQADADAPSYQKVIAAMMSGYKAIVLQTIVAKTPDVSADFMGRRNALLSNLERNLKDSVHNQLGEAFPVFVFNEAAPAYPSGLESKDILFFQVTIDFDISKADQNAFNGTVKPAAYRMFNMSGKENPLYTSFFDGMKPRTFEIFSPAADAAMQATATDLVVFIKEHKPQPFHKKD